MLFWVLAALLTLAACMAVLLPLVRGRGPEDSGRSHDLEVYRDQLAEVDRDAARGLIGAAEAEQARAEIGRRILRLGNPPTSATASNGTAQRAAGDGSRAGHTAGRLGALRRSRVARPAVAAAAGPDGEKSGRQLGRRTGGARRSASCRQSQRWPRLGCAGADLPAHRPRRRRGDRLPQHDPTQRRHRRSGKRARRGDRHGRRRHDFGGCARRPSAAHWRPSPAMPRRSSTWRRRSRRRASFTEAAAAWQAMLGTLPGDSPWRSPIERAIAEAERRASVAAGNGPRTARARIRSTRRPKCRRRIAPP